MNQLIEHNGHYYLLSEKKVNEAGGYYYNPKGFIMPITEKNFSVITKNGGKKIIASTDTGLGLPSIKNFIK